MPCFSVASFGVSSTCESWKSLTNLQAHCSQWQGRLWNFMSWKSSELLQPCTILASFPGFPLYSRIMECLGMRLAQSSIATFTACVAAIILFSLQKSQLGHKLITAEGIPDQPEPRAFQAACCPIQIIMYEWSLSLLCLCAAVWSHQPSLTEAIPCNSAG